MDFDSFPINTHLVKAPLQSLLSISFINAVYKPLIHQCLLEGGSGLIIVATGK